MYFSTNFYTYRQPIIIPEDPRVNIFGFEASLYLRLYK